MEVVDGEMVIDPEEEEVEVATAEVEEEGEEVAGKVTVEPSEDCTP